MTKVDKYRQMLTEFHTAFRLPIARSFCEAEQKNCQLRVNLIAEEYAEYSKAKERVDIIDGLGDTLYVVIGTAVTVGIMPEEYTGIPMPGNTTYKLLFPDPIVKLISRLQEKVLCYRGLWDNLTQCYWKCSAAAAVQAFDLMTAVELIHASNMTKLWEEKELGGIKDTPELFTTAPSGKKGYYIVKRAVDGKVVKSPSYIPVDLSGL
jgi:hypothetical protein